MIWSKLLFANLLTTAWKEMRIIPHTCHQFKWLFLCTEQTIKCFILNAICWEIRRQWQRENATVRMEQKSKVICTHYLLQDDNIMAKYKIVLGIFIGHLENLITLNDSLTFTTLLKNSPIFRISSYVCVTSATQLLFLQNSMPSRMGTTKEETICLPMPKWSEE